MAIKKNLLRQADRVLRDGFWKKNAWGSINGDKANVCLVGAMGVAAQRAWELSVATINIPVLFQNGGRPGTFSEAQEEELNAALDALITVLLKREPSWANDVVPYELGGQTSLVDERQHARAVKVSALVRYNDMFTTTADDVHSLLEEAATLLESKVNGS